MSKCKSKDCKKYASYNLEGQTPALYCKEHKKDNMVNVISKTCLHEDCNKRPNYNIEGKKIGLYCVKHKKENMVDVKSKTCLYDRCKKLPTYNLEGQKTCLYCKEHKKENMVNVRHKTCKSDCCITIPTYNLEGETKALYCKEHKKENMVDVIHKTCKSDWCSIRSTDKYEGYCLFCFTNLFPNKQVCRNYKTKELEVTSFVKTNFPDFTWVTDKRINGGCSRRRPDLCLDLGYQIILVEVDENQHIDYDCSCENKRVMELSKDVNHRPIIFIRFNPDEYSIFKDDETIKVTSCWSINKKSGLFTISKKKQKEWKNRLESLKQQINYWSLPDNKSEKMIEVVELFYDQNL